MGVFLLDFFPHRFFFFAFASFFSQGFDLKFSFKGRLFWTIF